MNTLRVLSTVLVLAAGIALIFGSAGFSSVAADRGVAISVVEDEHAYVGMAVCDQPATNSSGHPVEIRVQNRFAADLTIDTIEGRLETGPDPPNSVGTGDSETFRIRVENDTEAVTLFAHTESVSVEMTREIQNQSTPECGFSPE